MSKIKERIKFQAEADPHFSEEIMSSPGCEALRKCIQCGTCSGICPLSLYMDLAPRRIINLTRAGFKKDVLTSQTIWLCTSCYSCTVECPKGIKITDIMYALKQRAIKEGIYSRRFPIPLLAKEFYRMVKNHGRINESWLAGILFLKTNWVKMIKMTFLGVKLMLTGRFEYFLRTIKGKKEVAALLSATQPLTKEGDL